MALKLFNHSFPKDNPFIKIDYTIGFIKETNVQEMPEVQALVTQLSFLTEFDKSHYEVETEMVSPADGSMSSWAEAVQYFFKSYT